jgi:hypothetical protein
MSVRGPGGDRGCRKFWASVFGEGASPYVVGVSATEDTGDTGSHDFARDGKARDDNARD